MMIMSAGDQLLGRVMGHIYESYEKKEVEMQARQVTELDRRERP